METVLVGEGVFGGGTCCATVGVFLGSFVVGFEMGLEHILGWGEVLS